MSISLMDDTQAISDKNYEDLLEESESALREAWHIRPIHFSSFAEVNSVIRFALVTSSLNGEGVELSLAINFK